MKFILLIAPLLFLLSACDNPEAWSGGGSGNLSIEGEGNSVTIIDSTSNSQGEGTSSIDQLNPDNSETTTEVLDKGGE